MYENIPICLIEEMFFGNILYFMFSSIVRFALYVVEFSIQN